MLLREFYSDFRMNCALWKWQHPERKTKTKKIQLFPIQNSHLQLTTRKFNIPLLVILTNVNLNHYVIQDNVVKCKFHFCNSGSPFKLFTLNRVLSINTKSKTQCFCWYLLVSASSLPNFSQLWGQQTEIKERPLLTKQANSINSKPDTPNSSGMTSSKGRWVRETVFQARNGFFLFLRLSFT